MKARGVDEDAATKTPQLDHISAQQEACVCVIHVTALQRELVDSALA